MRFYIFPKHFNTSLLKKKKKIPKTTLYFESIQDVARIRPQIHALKNKKGALQKREHIFLQKNQSLEVHYMTTMQDRNAFVHLAIVLHK